MMVASIAERSTPARMLTTRPWEITGSEQRQARLALLGVLGIVAAVHVVAGLDRPINWDEAVHLTQVIPGRPAVFMEPHRTRGVSLLVAPIAVFDPSMMMLRVYLLLASLAGLYASFAVWIRVAGVAVPLAALLFSTYWVTVFYTVEVLPNVPSALLAVAITGLVGRSYLARGRRSDPLVVAVLFLLFALVRPPDAVLVGVGVALMSFAVARVAAWRHLVPAAIGGATGIAVWFLEGWIRFGFVPVETLGSGAEYSLDGERMLQFPVYLAYLEDRLRCAGSCLDEFAAAGGWQLPPWRTSLYLLLVGLAIVSALVSGSGQRKLAGIAVAPALLLIGFYGVAGGAANMRYLLPAGALLMIAAAIGVRSRWSALPKQPRALRGASWALGMVVLVALTVWQSGHGVERLSAEAGVRHRVHNVASELTASLDGRPCSIGSAVGYPQVQYWTGCHATAIVRGADGTVQAPLGERGSYRDLAAAAARGEQVLALIRKDPPSAAPVAAWARVHGDALAAEGLELRIWEEGDPLPPPPCPDALGGADRRLAEVLSTRC